MKTNLKFRSARTPRSVKDLRLWFGILLMGLSVLLTQSVISKANARTEVLVLVKDIPAGSPVTRNDLQIENVVLPAITQPFDVTTEILGFTATRDLFTGEVLITNSVTAIGTPSLRLVSVPIKAGHLPILESGQLVDIWVTPSMDGMALPGPAQLVIGQATISDIPTEIDPTLDTAVTLLIARSEVQVLVQAIRDGVIDLVALPNNRRSDQ